MTTELRTERLLLREWRDDDLEPFAALNADPQVMEYFPSVQTREQSDAFVHRIAGHFDRHGYGLWAVELLDGSAPFVGFVGLQVVPFETHFTPAVEVGWRLAQHAWGRGYATEAARAAMEFGFGEAGLAEIVSITAAVNERSQRVMRKLGMHRDPAGDFDHPRMPEPPLRHHVLYRLVASS